MTKSYLEARNPFAQENCLLNVTNGTVAKSNVNVDKVKEIGHKIFNSMTEENDVEYSFKRKEQAMTFGQSNSIKIGKEEVQVDPQLLFQRLVTAGERTD